MWIGVSFYRGFFIFGKSAVIGVDSNAPLFYSVLSIWAVATTGFLATLILPRIKGK
jgi:hypothetical protein